MTKTVSIKRESSGIAGAVGTQDDIGGSNDAKEAVAFAILGNETLHSRVNNAPAATGAAQGVILGKIIPNPWEAKM